MSLEDRLLTLSVDDVMNKAVISISVSQSMEAAAELFSEHEISSAPVVDSAGRCVGILSASDFANAVRPGGAEQRGASHELLDDDSGFHLDSTPLEHVQRHMTAAIQTVASSSPLLTAARIMCTEHIHHLPVIDRQGRPAGIVSTMDIVAALINAVDEMRAEQQH